MPVSPTTPVHTLTVGACCASVLLSGLFSQRRAVVSAGTCVGGCHSHTRKCGDVPAQKSSWDVWLPSAAILKPKGCETWAGTAVPLLCS